MKNTLKSLLFKKYIASYALVFSIPLLILIIVLNSLYLNNLREEQRTANENYLEYSDQLLSDQLLEVRSIGNYINQSDFINQYSSFLIDNHNNYRELISQYEQSANAIKALFVVNTESGTVFSSRGNMTVDAMLNYSMHFSSLKNKTGISELITRSEENIYAYKNNLIYTMPFFERNRHVGTLVFSINLTPLQSQLNLVSERDQGYSFLLGPDDNIVLSSQNLADDTLASYNINDILSEETLPIDGSTFLMSNKPNEFADLTLVNLTDSRHFNQPIRQGLVILAALISLLTIVGLSVSYYFAKRNYKPVHAILKDYNDNEPIYTNEWQFINETIESNKKKAVNLDKQLKQQAPIIRNALLLDLLEDRINDKNKLVPQLEAKGITFPYTHFVVAVIDLTNESISAKQLLSIETLKESVYQLNSEGKYSLEIATPYLKNNEVFVIINSNSQSRKKLDPIIKALQNFFNSEVLNNQYRCAIGIGRFYNNLEKVSNSYIEANSALDHREQNVTKENEVVFYSNLSTTTGSLDKYSNIVYPEENIMLLMQSIKQGNKSIALEQLRDIFNSIKNSDMPKIAVETIVAGVTNGIISTGNNLKVDGHQQFIFELDNFSNLKSAECVLSSMIELIISETIKNIDQQSDKIGKEISAYIINNFDDPGISLEQISADYDISISYASKIIKEETGKSFSTIVQSLRMKQFKELLTTTKRPIKELVSEVGYYDVSNFTRKFRQENDMTPGQYRKKFQNS